MCVLPLTSNIIIFLFVAISQPVQSFFGTISTENDTSSLVVYDSRYSTRARWSNDVAMGREITLLFNEVAIR